MEKSAFKYWVTFVRNNGRVSRLGTSEIDELAEIVLSAIDEELHNPLEKDFRMTWCLSSAEPSSNVRTVMNAAGLKIVEGRYCSYIEWHRFLTTEE